MFSCLTVVRNKDIQLVGQPLCSDPQPSSPARSQTFNEIMPCIYGQFMEKEARQWRQIYKVSLPCHLHARSFTMPSQALQLLEYLIKHGSERVVDDARSHTSTLKMLRNFHYIDDKGKDQGQNGTSFLSYLLQPHHGVFHQFAIALVNWSSYSWTWKPSVPRDVKQRLIVGNTLVLAMIQ